jgi:hypothetical protein
VSGGTTVLEVVVVKLPRRSDGDIAFGAHILVYPEDAGDDDTRIRHYDCDLAVLTLFKPGEMEARFHASWDGHSWTLCGRAQPTHSDVLSAEPDCTASAEPAIAAGNA